MIYMRGLKSDDLSAVLDFLYFGEANVYQDNLDSFLALAEELKLKGLTGAVKNKSNDYQDTADMPRKSNEPKKEKTIYESDNHTKNMEEFRNYQDTSLGTEVALNSHKVVSAELEQLDEQINSMMEHSGRKITVGGRQFTAMICKVCGKETQKSHMIEHIEAHHITGVAHTCDICGMTSRSRSGLRGHKIKHRT